LGAAICAWTTGIQAADNNCTAPSTTAMKSLTILEFRRIMM